MHQLPKAGSFLKKVESKIKKDKDLPLPHFTQKEIDDIFDSNKIQQELEKMKAKKIMASTEITADVVDAVKWQDTKNIELQNMKIQDVNKDKPWIDELIEDFITYDLSTSLRDDEAKTILTELEKEIKEKEDSGFGPEARNYLYSLKRELGVVIEKL